MSLALSRVSDMIRSLTGDKISKVRQRIAVTVSSRGILFIPVKAP